MSKLKEAVARNLMVQCQKGEPFECLHISTCQHADEDICQWQREETDSILAPVRAEVEKIRAENPNEKCTPPYGGRYRGFEQACQAILKALE